MTFSHRAHTLSTGRPNTPSDGGAWIGRITTLLVALLLVMGGGHSVDAQEPTARTNSDPEQTLSRDSEVPTLTGVPVGASTQPKSEQEVVEASASTAPEAPQFFNTWWFVAVCAGLMGALGVFYWARTRALRHKLEERTDKLTAKKERAEQRAHRLEEMSDAKSEMLKELSHTFRTPLTLTLGPIDNILEGKHGALNEDARTQLRLAQRNGTRLLWLVNQLLDLAELESGNMILKATHGNFVQFVAKGMWSFEGLAERRDIRLGLEASLQDSDVWFDEGKMEKILGNLLTGAFRSAKEGGAIRVRVRPVEDDDEQVEMVVEDTGTGFASDDKNGTAEQYSRPGTDLWDSADVRTSVGLHLVEELVELHEGHIIVDGQMGEHIRFIVRLPRRPEAAEEMADAPRGDALPRGLKGESPGALTLTRKALAQEIKNGDGLSSPAVHGYEARPDEKDRTTILVIDDNKVVRTLVRSHLEPEYRVEEAPEGAAGYNLASSLLPDLVIADVMMPEMDGFELCRKIKTDPDVDHIPVIFLTARADLEGKIEGLDVGADVYLTKPFEPEELIAHVKNLIATRRSLRESLRDERAHRGVSGDGPPGGVNPEGVQAAADSLPPTAGGKPLKERIEEVISENLTDPDFGVSELASSTALSSSQLRRRMKEAYDRTPVQLIRRRRLEAGAQLLREREDATIGEVAYAVGFNSQSYFSRSFRDEFGTSPSRYRSQHDGIQA